MNSAEKLMEQFRLLVKAKGWTVDEIYDLLTHGAMFHCRPSHSSVAKWLSGDRIASGAHLLSILDFVQTHSKNGIKLSVHPRSQTKQVKR